MRRIIATVVFALLVSGPVFAQGKGNSNGNANKGKGPKQIEQESDLPDSVKDILLGDQDSKKAKGREDDEDQEGIGEILVDIVFGDDERETIRDYYSGRSVNVDTLPPGIAKNLRRGKPLPPGIAKKNLPNDLESRLPIRDGLRRQILGNDIALIDEENNLIVDIIQGVLNR